MTVHTGLVTVSAELASKDLLRADRSNTLENFDLLIAQQFRVTARRRLHRDVGEQVKQMVLHYVSNRARLIVEVSAAVDTEIFGHGDLYALDVLAIPDWLDEGVTETEEQNVLDGILSEVVIDAEYI